MLTDQDIEKLKESLASKKDIEILKASLATKEDLAVLSEDLASFRAETKTHFETIEKDLKSVVRIYNLDEEMSAVYDRLKHLEEKAGINGSIS